MLLIPAQLQYGGAKIKTDAAPRKKINPEAVVVATGCYVQVSEEEARADAAVDLVLGNNQKRQIVTALDAYFEGRTFDDVLADVEKEQYEELEVSTVLEHTRAFVKVQDGCNQFCSYCIIPYARGRVRSVVWKTL